MDPHQMVQGSLGMEARAYAMSLSREVDMTNCYKHCKHFFERCRALDFNVLIAYWMMAGILGPIDSVEEAYKKGHKILLDLTYLGEEKMLKTSDENGSMIEFVAPTDSEPIPCCRHEGFCFTSHLGFVDLLDLGQLWKVACTDGMLKTVPPNTRELLDHPTRQNGSVLLIDGNRLSSQVFQLSRKLRYLACFKPHPYSLRPLLETVTGKLSVLIIRDCELLQEIDIPLEKFKKLTVLEISGLSHVTTTEPLLDKISHLSQLQCLHLSDLLIEVLPTNFFSNLQQLRWLILRGCSKLVSLPSIRGLKGLNMVDLSHCSALQKIATSVIQNPHLQMLDFSYTSMINIPTIKESPNLTHLIARDVEVSVLISLRQVNSLEVLDLSGAHKVKQIHMLGNNKNVKILDLSRAEITSIDYLPDLIHLRDLKLRDCTYLIQLPPVKSLTKLEVLDISGCENLCDLPEGLSSLKSLKELNLFGCRCLEKMSDGLFDEMTCLEKLDLSKTKATHLPSFANLANLHSLSLGECTKLEELRGVENLIQLVVLNISGSENLFDLPEVLSNLKSLKELDLSGYRRLEKMREGLFDDMSCLEKLDLSKTKVTHLPTLANLANLHKLSLGGQECAKLEELRGVGNLTQLEVLDISGCPYLTALPKSLMELRSLKELNLSGCGCLAELREGLFEHMSCLEKLDLSKTSVKHLDSFADLTNLQTLNLSYTKVTCLPSFVNLINLSKLSLGALELHSVGGLTSLSSLVA